MEVQVEVVIGTNHFVIVQDDLTAATFEQSWFFDAASGLMKATVSYNNVFLLDGSGNATATTLAQFITANPAAAGDTWTLLYTDNDGGPYQARLAQFEFFFNDPGDPGITANGDICADEMYGTSGSDTLNGNAGNDILIGRGGIDLLDGGADNDQIDGGDGNDLITGGAGNDQLTGGLGNDTFRFNFSTEGVDHITDFNAGTNATTVDRLQFDVGGPAFAIGNNNTTVDNFHAGNNAAINLANTEVAVKTDAGVSSANIQTTIDGYGNITTGAVFTFFDTTKGHAVVYYDANPSAAGGAVLVAELDNVNSLAQLANLNASDFSFI